MAIHKDDTESIAQQMQPEQQRCTHSQNLSHDELEHCIVSNPHLLQQLYQPIQQLVPVNQTLVIHVLHKQHPVVPLACCCVHINDRCWPGGQKANWCPTSLVMLNDLLQLFVQKLRQSLCPLYSQH